MRAVIDGQSYDTDLAREVARATSGRGTTDLRFFDEAMFLTANGAWFLAGRGNALTKYARRTGGCLDSGERVIPLSSGDVYSWLTFYGLVGSLNELLLDAGV